LRPLGVADIDVDVLQIHRSLAHRALSSREYDWAFYHASSCAAIFREISARHSSIGLKPGSSRQWASGSRYTSSSRLSRSISKPQGCETYHGVSQNISMRLPSGSWK